MIPGLQDLSVDILFHFIVQVFPLEEEKKKTAKAMLPQYLGVRRCLHSHTS